MNGIKTWWDGVEAWLTGLAFLPQLLVTLAVLIPASILVALVINLLVRAVLELFGRGGDVAEGHGGEG